MKRYFELVALGILAWIGASTVYFFNARYPTVDLQYGWQALAFLHGRLDVARDLVLSYSPMDFTVRGGRYFWPLGPLPSIALLPLVAAFGARAAVQMGLQFALDAGIAGLAWVVARRGGIDRLGAAWLAAAFCFGSVAIGALAAHGPWQIAHTLALLLSLGAVAEWQGKRRGALMGALVGLAVMSRLTAGATAIFIGLMLLREHGLTRRAIAALARFALPIAACVCLLGALNAVRFGSPFDNGYADSFLYPSDFAARRAETGVFNLANVPRNLRYYFLALPAVGRGGVGIDPYGMSFFLLSPVFLLLALRPRRDAAWLAVAAACAPALAVFLTYYTTGVVQFGPRYLNDVLPLLYLLLVDVARRRPLRAPAKTLIFASGLLNCFLFAAYVQMLVRR